MSSRCRFIEDEAMEVGARDEYEDEFDEGGEEEEEEEEITDAIAPSFLNTEAEADAEAETDAKALEGTFHLPSLQYNPPEAASSAASLLPRWRPLKCMQWAYQNDSMATQPEYCYLCDTPFTLSQSEGERQVQQSENFFVSMDEQIRAWYKTYTNIDSQTLCQQIQEFYNTRIRPFAGTPAWSIRCIYTHITQHDPREDNHLNIMSEDLRDYQRLKARLIQTIEQYDETDDLQGYGKIDLKKIETLMKINKEKREIMRFITETKARETF